MSYVLVYNSNIGLLLCPMYSYIRVISNCCCVVWNRILTVISDCYCVVCNRILTVISDCCCVVCNRILTVISDCYCVVCDPILTVISDLYCVVYNHIITLQLRKNVLNTIHALKIVYGICNILFIRFTVYVENINYNSYRQSTPVKQTNCSLTRNCTLSTSQHKSL